MYLLSMVAHGDLASLRREAERLERTALSEARTGGISEETTAKLAGLRRLLGRDMPTTRDT